jgi:hypothetical protein
MSTMVANDDYMRIRNGAGFYSGLKKYKKTL